MSSLVAVLTDKADRTTLPAPIIEDLTGRVFNLKFSTSLGTGFMRLTASIMLPRWRAYGWYERFLFYGINVYEADEPVWEGRIAQITVKEYGVDVTCEGYWSNLTDQIMFSWWNDDDMGNWKVPTPGAGGISDEISLPQGATTSNLQKYSFQQSANYMMIAYRRNVVYADGDKGVFYYALPRISNLTDKRVFQPATIHGIQLVFDATSTLRGDAKIWTADHPRGTWTERKVLNYFGEQSLPLFVNLEADGADVEAVAIGTHTTAANAGTQTDDTSRLIFTDVTVYAERDANRFAARKTTPKKIVKDLLVGNSNLDVTSHASQIANDFLLVEESASEIVPAVFDGSTIQDIIVKTTALGLVDSVNLMKAPSAEILVAVRSLEDQGWKFNGAATNATQVADVPAGEPNLGTYSGRCDIPNTDQVGWLWQEPELITGTLIFDPGRIPIETGLTYTFSVWAKVSAGPKNFHLQILFYDAYTGGTLLGTAAATPSLTTTWARYSVTGAAPANATHAVLRLITNGAQSTFQLFADGVQLTESAAIQTYLDGNSEGCAWSGETNLSKSIRTIPAITGVYGRNRLHIKRRTQIDYKWVVPLGEIAEGGLALQKSTQDFWVRVWARYEDAFSGFTKYADAAQNVLGQSMIFSERDTILPVGRGLAGFARGAASAFLKDTKHPKQASQLTISGLVLSSGGGREPLWRVRAGDLMLVPDLAPLAGVPTSAISVSDPTALDKLTLFTIKETEYDGATGTLTITPDGYPNWLEFFLVQITSTPSRDVVASPSVAGGGSFGGGFGGAGIG